MTPRNEHKYRADHVGSLLRPQSVHEAIGRRFRQQIDESALTRVQDEAILDSLEHQRAAGVDVFTDGEFRRFGFLTGFTEAVDGFVVGDPNSLEWRGGTGTEPQTPIMVVGGRIKARDRVAETEASFMREHSPGPFKITLPSPALFALETWQGEDSGYSSRAEFIADAAAILAEEAHELAREGASYIQVDAPEYTHFADRVLSEQLHNQGVDASTLDSAIAADNAIVQAARDAGAVAGVHLCRGNSIGRWLAEGSYEPIAEKLFTGLQCDRLLLEYDSDRAGGFEPLRFIGDNKIVVLGLISTKSGELESRDEVLRRIEEATTHVPIDRLALCPQCGFASGMQGNPLSAGEQWRKLELVASVADEVWGGNGT
jgi:5-methyltetrahydropteroyltriglutamate--homocysteine methyltransferase